MIIFSIKAVIIIRAAVNCLPGIITSAKKNLGVILEKFFSGNRGLENQVLSRYSCLRTDGGLGQHHSRTCSCKDKSKSQTAHHGCHAEERIGWELLNPSKVHIELWVNEYLYLN